MSRFVSDDDVKVIHSESWGNNETVTIRRFGYGDRQYLAGETVRVGMSDNGDQESMIADVQVGQMNLAILERGIVAWTLKGPEDEVMPLSRASIERLTDPDGDFILTEINQFNPRRQRTPKAQASFRGTDGDRAEGEQPAAERLDGRLDLRGDGVELA